MMMNLTMCLKVSTVSLFFCNGVPLWPKTDVLRALDG